MSQFEDPELESLLRRAGGGYPDVNVAYETLQRRVRHARRKRAVLVSGVACGVLFATGLMAASRSGDSQPAQIGDRDTFDVSFPDDTNNPQSTDRSVPDSEPVGTSPTVGTNGTTPGTDNGGTVGSNPSTSPPTTTDPPPTTSVFSGEGGSVTVRLQGGSLTLVSYSANAGFAIDIQHSGGDRVEVRFESSNHRTRIRVDLEGNSMVPSIEEDPT
jgi:hypothetical protein